MLQEVYNKQIKKDVDKLLNEFKIEGLEEVIIKMHHLKNNRFYEKFLHAYKNRDKIFQKGEQIDPKEMPKLTLFNLAYHNLNYPSLNIPPMTDLITLSNVNAMYYIFEYLYCIKACRKLNHEDGKNIYLSGLDGKILFALDKFDEIKTTTEPTTEFFQKLKTIEWQDKSSKTLYKKLNNLRDDSIYGITITIRFGGLSVVESSFLLLLAACSALKKNKTKIDQEDVLRAYITYFKLIETDITKFETQPDFNDPKGYLICENCGGYYQLQSEESPDDFDDKCECGGHLQYVASLKDN